MVALRFCKANGKEKKTRKKEVRNEKEKRREGEGEGKLFATRNVSGPLEPLNEFSERMGGKGLQG